MPEVRTGSRIRSLDELDLGAIVKIDEHISGQYRPDVWEKRVMYYLRRDPDASQVAEIDGQVVGFMLGEVRTGEFGLEEPGGWVDRFGIHPEHRGRDLGKQLFEAMRAHFTAQGATTIRTLVDRRDRNVRGFLEALGFATGPLEALEVPLTPGAPKSA